MDMQDFETVEVAKSTLRTFTRLLTTMQARVDKAEHRERIATQRLRDMLRKPKRQK